MPGVESGLKAGQRQVEKIMLDAVEVVANLGGVEDDVLDPETGALRRPEGDGTVLYGVDSTGDGGRALGHPEGQGGVASITPADSRATEADGIVRKAYTVTIPLDAPEVPVFSFVHVVHSARDIDLEDAWFTVDEVVHSTFAVARKLMVTERARAQR